MAQPQLCAEYIEQHQNDDDQQHHGEDSAAAATAGLDHGRMFARGFVAIVGHVSLPVGLLLMRNEPVKERFRT